MVGLADPAVASTTRCRGGRRGLDGLVWVGEDGSVRWTDEAYRLHGRPRWRRVRSVDDVTRGLSTADTGRVTAAYLMLMITGDVELLYTVTGETGQPHDVLLRGAWPGVAMVQRASYAAAGPSTTAAPLVEAEPTEVPEPAAPVDVVVVAVAEETVVATVEVVGDGRGRRGGRAGALRARRARSRARPGDRPCVPRALRREPERPRRAA